MKVLAIRHKPQLAHFSLSYFNVTTSLRQVKSPIIKIPLFRIKETSEVGTLAQALMNEILCPDIRGTERDS
ncbi:Uncharacterized protein dnm_078790 [Desulfonema magnum]|uniref:Uncharacterized protein n=1 Tax=Desulfonema magnum TaxID=45655 RepID=A0A975BU09_9BACT|nr:Uncharacterized protein dnm_078790 [Desulfonema magnum]